RPSSPRRIAVDAPTIPAPTTVIFIAALRASVAARRSPGARRPARRRAPRPPARPGPGTRPTGSAGRAGAPGTAARARRWPRGWGSGSPSPDADGEPLDRRDGGVARRQDLGLGAGLVEAAEA